MRNRYKNKSPTGSISCSVTVSISSQILSHHAMNARPTHEDLRYLALLHTTKVISALQTTDYYYGTNNYRIWLDWLLSTVTAAIGLRYLSPVVRAARLIRKTRYNGLMHISLFAERHEF